MTHAINYVRSSTKTNGDEICLCNNKGVEMSILVCNWMGQIIFLGDTHQRLESVKRSK